MLAEKQILDDQILGKGPLEISIKPLMTVKELKLKILQDYNIPIDLQYWLINDQKLNDDDKLIDSGIKDESNNLNLYINKNNKDLKLDKQIQINYKLLSDITDSNANTNTIIISDEDEILNEEAAGAALPIPDIIRQEELSVIQRIDEDDNFEWKCLICTFVNPPLTLSCTMCSHEKPLSVEEKSNISEELKIFLNDENDNRNNIITIADDEEEILNEEGCAAVGNNIIIITDDEEEILNEEAAVAALPIPNTRKTEIIEVYDNCGWKCLICTFVNPSLTLACSMCSHEKPLSLEEKSNISEELKIFLNDENDNRNNIITIADDEEEILNEEGSAAVGNNIIIIADDVDEILNEEAAGAALPIPDTKKTEIIEVYDNCGWKCLICTFVNPSLTLACSMCSHEKPLSVEEKSIISEELKKFLNDDNDGNLNQSHINNMIEEIIKPNTELNIEIPSASTDIEKNTKLSKPSPPSICHYIEILNLDTNDIVRNTNSFDCPICFTNIEFNEGCILRDCLHTFCKDCLAGTIEYSDDAEIKCPYSNGDYNCNSFLQDREIRSLVTLEIYEKHLAKSVRYAEHQIKNSYHCKTPNCQGWCILDDNILQFECPVCNLMNCLICKVIHNGLSCYEYQGELNRNSQIKSEVQKTDEMINEMVNTGQVMNCPKCQVIITKLSGCDWLQCLMCKTEVCWATRGPRWGPAGRGDKSGGCKCNYSNGVKCHPNCGNCH